MNKLKTFLQTFVLVGTLFITSCSSSDYIEGEVYDPLEPYNRAMFSFNEGLDYVLLNPVTEAYRFVTPDAFRISIDNFLAHIKAPIYLVNELLQGDISGAANVTRRFVLNTVVGFGGVFDAASEEGWEHNPEDFGQTLATWGVGSGPYIVLPILGPSNLRDTVGLVGDAVMDPINWYVWNHDKDDLGLGRTIATVLSTKDQYLDLQKDLKRNSLDYYAATRSVWSQRRQALIADSNANGGDSYVEYE